MVKSTPFEELCNRINKKNSLRDLHVGILKDIMLAYSFMRCVLDLENIPISSEDIYITTTEITNRLKSPSQKYPEVDMTVYVWDAKYVRDAIAKKKSAYFKNQLRLDYLSRIKLRGYNFEETDSPFTRIALQENLWDPNNRRFDPEKLGDYVKKYNWAFPPNVQELLDEVLKEKETA